MSGVKRNGLWSDQTGAQKNLIAFESMALTDALRISLRRLSVTALVKRIVYGNR